MNKLLFLLVLSMLVGCASTKYEPTTKTMYRNVVKPCTLKDEYQLKAGVNYVSSKELLFIRKNNIKMDSIFKHIGYPVTVEYDSSKVTACYGYKVDRTLIDEIDTVEHVKTLSQKRGDADLKNVYVHQAKQCIVFDNEGNYINTYNEAINASEDVLYRPEVVDSTYKYSGKCEVQEAYVVNDSIKVESYDEKSEIGTYVGIAGVTILGVVGLLLIILL